ncbi:hypothetical protein TNCV_2371651 [Trichonephila clavipes]|nr:hypothetical protein TNCV_2371651 [Trichonephila clavipes]
MFHSRHVWVVLAGRRASVVFQSFPTFLEQLVPLKTIRSNHDSNTVRLFNHVVNLFARFMKPYTKFDGASLIQKTRSMILRDKLVRKVENILRSHNYIEKQEFSHNPNDKRHKEVRLQHSM